MFMSSVVMGATLSPQEQQMYQDWLAQFKKADINNSGGLSQAELDADQGNRFTIMKKRFTAIDSNRDGQVTTVEYGMFMDQRRKKWEAAFKAADSNNSGGLSKLELERLPPNKFGSIRKNFDAMDGNRDGQVTIAEADAYKAARKPPTPVVTAPAEDWQATFKRADLNDSGGLSRLELDKTAPDALSSLKQGFDKADSNRDGQVTPAEYQAFQTTATTVVDDDEDEGSTFSFIKQLLGQ